MNGGNGDGCVLFDRMLKAGWGVLLNDPDPYPMALLAAEDAAGDQLAEVRVAPDFKLSASSALAWVADEFRQPD
ncbi:MAG: hypothetical protein Q8S26_08610 [Azonexus sp.]|nr:hypothetical protein [Azonexus sp.]